MQKHIHSFTLINWNLVVLHIIYKKIESCIAAPLFNLKNHSVQQFGISVEACFIHSSTLPPKAGEDITPLVQYSLILLFICKI